MTAARHGLPVQYKDAAWVLRFFDDRDPRTSPEQAFVGQMLKMPGDRSAFKVTGVEDRHLVLQSSPIRVPIDELRAEGNGYRFVVSHRPSSAVNPRGAQATLLRNLPIRARTSEKSGLDPADYPLRLSSNSTSREEVEAYRQLSQLSYVDPIEDAVAFLKGRGFRDVSSVVYNEAELLIAVTPDASKVVFAFRGTSSREDLLSDVDARFRPSWSGKFHVHAGMQRHLNQILCVAADDFIDLASKYPEAEKVLTGHSLGAGAADLFALYLGETLSPEESKELGPVKRVLFSSPHPLTGEAGQFVDKRFPVQHYYIRGDLVTWVPDRLIASSVASLLTALQVCKSYRPTGRSQNARHALPSKPTTVEFMGMDIPWREGLMSRHALERVRQEIAAGAHATFS